MVQIDGLKLAGAIRANGLTPTATAAAAHCSLESVRAAMRGRPIGEGTAYAISCAVRRPLPSLLASGATQAAHHPATRTEGKKAQPAIAS
jgi:hypothetical protein